MADLPKDNDHSIESIIEALTQHGLFKNKSISNPDVSLNHYTTSSRAVLSGSIFIAYKGVASDGHRYCNDAIAHGASLVIVEDGSEIPDGNVLVVSSGRAAWSVIASLFTGSAHRQLKFIGVTGTNGKSSTTWIIHHILRGLNKKSLLVGTMGAWKNETFIPTKHTTPDPDFLYPLFADALENGVEYVVMEVSSHAIQQAKLMPIRFDSVLFTSFSRDHLDFHPTMEDYWNTKWRLFSDEFVDSASHAFVCSTLDQCGFQIPIQSIPAILDSYGPKQGPLSNIGVIHELAILQKKTSGTEISITLDGQSLEGTAPFVGQFALENFCGALAAVFKATGERMSPEQWQGIPGVPGRLEKVNLDSSGPSVFVDYAHTPDALDKAISTLREIPHSQLTVVFGCGGDRDPGKRPEMFKACKDADRIIVTSDNPRSEDPEKIIAVITANADHKNWQTESDRALAIAQAIKEATSSDLVLIAGKGHETYQINGSQQAWFSDQDVCRFYLSERHDALQSERPSWFEIGLWLDKTLCQEIPSTVAAIDLQRINRDSRSIKPGEWYLPIVGERFDGHEFICDALEKGAIGFFCNQSFFNNLDSAVQKKGVVVSDTLLAIQHIARGWRLRNKGCKFIALTGSAGKTTAKEMLALIMGQLGPTNATYGSYNNELGLPITLLATKATDRFCVLEMGARKPGDIAFLTDIAQQNVSCLLNVGVAHLGIFGSLENLRKTKQEIFNSHQHLHHLVVAADDEQLVSHAKAVSNELQIPLTTFGYAAEADVHIKGHTIDDNGRTAIELKTGNQNFSISMNGFHSAWVINAAAATAMALAAGATSSDISKSLHGFSGLAGRYKIHRKEDLIVIDDSYNSNPNSVIAGLNSLEASFPNQKTTFVIGDMLELGDESKKMHADIGAEICSRFSNCTLFTVGTESLAVWENMNSTPSHYSSVDELLAHIRMENLEGVIYIKGSNSIGLNKVVRKLVGDSL